MLGILGLKLPMFVMAFPSEWISFIWTDVGKWVGSVVPKGRPIALSLQWTFSEVFMMLLVLFG